MTEEIQQQEGSESPDVHHVQRSKRIYINSAGEIGALIRLARQRLGMSQTDAAVCCGVGRRFFVELENGKPTVQLDKVLIVMDTLGLNLTVGGSGAAFTSDELSSAIVKREAGEPAHVWSAEFVSGIEAPYQETPETETRPHRGRMPGSVALKYRRKAGVKDEGGNVLVEMSTEDPAQQEEKKRTLRGGRVSVQLRKPKRRNTEK